MTIFSFFFHNQNRKSKFFILPISHLGNTFPEGLYFYTRRQISEIFTFPTIDKLELWPTSCFFRFGEVGASFEDGEDKGDGTPNEVNNYWWFHGQYSQSHPVFSGWLKNEINRWLGLKEVDDQFQTKEKVSSQVIDRFCYSSSGSCECQDSNHSNNHIWWDSYWILRKELLEIRLQPRKQKEKLHQYFSNTFVFISLISFFSSKNWYILLRQSIYVPGKKFGG